VLFAKIYCHRETKPPTAEIGRVRIVDDFLLALDALMPREENVKVTLSLSRRSLDYFKHAAKAQRGTYQRMIRALVDAHAKKQQASETQRHVPQSSL
jgi:hypothetical protein